LHTTQPAIFQRIRELEMELGVKLINRTQKNLSLTPKGANAWSMQSASWTMHPTCWRMWGSTESISGRARLGVGESIALSWLPTLLSDLGTEYPNLSVDVVVDLTRPLCRGLETADFDVIILGGATVVSQCRIVELGSATLAWLAKPSAGAWSEPMTAEDLRSQRILMLSQDTMMNQMAEDWFARYGTHPSRVDICNSMAVLASLTMAGRGISLLPPLLFERDIREGRLCVISTLHPVEPIVYRAIYRPVRWPPFGRLIAELAQKVTIFDKAGTATAERPGPKRARRPAGAPQSLPPGMSHIDRQR
jgi:DNA-binding transcriptional LysR family regulator